VQSHHLIFQLSCQLLNLHQITHVNDLIRQAAQIISRQAPGVSLEKIESKGKAIGGQALFGIANQIAQNPNGIFTQAIIQLVKQDTNDGG
jgi:hypothetical protein